MLALINVHRRGRADTLSKALRPAKTGLTIEDDSDVVSIIAVSVDVVQH